MAAVPDIASLARQRGGGALSHQAAWHTALGRLSSVGIDFSHVTRLAGEAPSADCLNALAGLLANTPSTGDGHDSSQISALYEAIDRSAFTTTDWLTALAGYYRHAGACGKHPHLLQALGYLECCAAAAKTQPGEATLAEIAADMLAQYGLED